MGKQDGGGCNWGPAGASSLRLFLNLKLNLFKKRNVRQATHGTDLDCSAPSLLLYLATSLQEHYLIVHAKTGIELLLLVSVVNLYNCFLKQTN